MMDFDRKRYLELQLVEIESKVSRKSIQVVAGSFIDYLNVKNLRFVTLLYKKVSFLDAGLRPYLLFADTCEHSSS